MAQSTGRIKSPVRRLVCIFQFPKVTSIEELVLLLCTGPHSAQWRTFLFHTCLLIVICYFWQDPFLFFFAWQNLCSFFSLFWSFFSDLFSFGLSPQKNVNFWDNIPIMVAPHPHRTFQTFLNFRHFWIWERFDGGWTMSYCIRKCQNESRSTWADIKKGIFA